MVSRFKMTERAFKNIINLTFLTLSSFLIVYFLIQLTPNPIIKIGISVFAVILEVFMQYLLSTGRVRWREKLRLRACVLFSLYGLYILAYAIPSATGFFMVEIKAQEETSARAEIVENTDQQRLTQISSTIHNLNAQLLTESKSGYGRRSQLIMDEIKRLTVEQRSIQIHFESARPAQKTIPKDLFKVMGDVFRIPGNVLKLLIFSISVLMVYTGLIMTSWDLSFATNENEELEPGDEMRVEMESKIPEFSKIYPPYEAPEAIFREIRIPELNGNEPPPVAQKSVKAEKVICPTCGKRFPVKKDKTFCCSSCRLRAYHQYEANG